MSDRKLNNILSLIFSIALAAIVWPGELRVFAAGNHLDPSFSPGVTVGNGKKIVDFAEGQDRAQDVVVQADGKILVVGSTESSGFALVRLLPNSSVDTGFGTDGFVITFLSSSSTSANDVVVQPDGKIVVAGSYLDGGSLSPMVAVVRYNSNGSLDTTFGSGGIVRTTLGPVNGLSSHGAQGLAVQSDGKIVAAGYTTTNNITDWGVLRLNTNGTLDTTFGGDGRVQTDFGGNSGEIASAVTILSNGRILVAGTGNPGGQDFALALYTTNGSLDTTFGGGDGKVTTDFNGGNDLVFDMRLQTDGRIVVAGSAAVTNPNFAAARYNADGSLDATFSGDGKVVTDLNASGTDQANDLAIQTDGKIVLAGSNGSGDFNLVRYTPTGGLDTTFGRNGVLQTDINSSIDTANAIALQRDGRIAVAGTMTPSGQSGDNFAVVRYNPNSGTMPVFDFDDDGKTDLSVFRPSVGEWWYLKSSTGGNAAAQFGQSSDKMTPADFTGDGKTDIAFWRPGSGEWFVLRSEDFSFYSFPFGQNNDTPVVGDFDGDNKADPTIFRSSNRTWYVMCSSMPTRIFPFGQNGDLPAPGDYDGDGKTDFAVFHPANGTWWILRSENNASLVYQFGNSTDKIVQGDYTGDGKTDVAVFRPSNGTWYVLRSENSSFYSAQFGVSTDLPAPGDYDGDGKIDIAVYRSSDRNWYVQKSTGGNLIQQFGVAGDLPVPGAFVR